MKIISLSEKRAQKKSSGTSTPEKRAQKSQALNQANQEIKKETGIDFVKMLLGDKEEKKRFEMKRYQERLDTYKKTPFLRKDVFL